MTLVQIKNNPQVRDSIVSLEQRMKDHLVSSGENQPDMPLKHVFAPGAYAREIFIPKHTLVVGKIHKHSHLNMLMKGRVSVLTEDGPVEYEAPLTMVSPAGVKRVVYTHEDTIWVTVHLTNETNLDKIEDEIISKTYEEFDKLKMDINLPLLEVIP